MADILTRAGRSALMARIRQHDTAPEVRLRKRLHAAGFRYVLHPKSLPGRPDFVLPKYRIAVFVHGCFWHGHECRAGRAPSTNRAYWTAKFAANRERDNRKVAELESRGWTVITVWECATKGARLEATSSALVDVIRQNAP